MIKQVVKRMIPRSVIIFGRGINHIRRKQPQLSLWKAIRVGRVVLPKSKANYMDDYVRQFSIILDKLHIDTTQSYIYPFDSKILRVYNRILICSITVDFNKVIMSDLNQIRQQLSLSKDRVFAERELKAINSIEKLASRISKKLSKKKIARAKQLASFFPLMLYRKPQSLDEAIQKILFYDALFWQMEHYHIGLGRLDMILYEYYKRDVKEGVITEEEAKSIIKELLLTLGKDTTAKSNGLIGDTGQYILLGGIDSSGEIVDNELTELFIELMAELRIPDPKLILRVNKNTSNAVWEKAIKCIMTGIGSPLIMDEEPIMKKMVEFGYEASDVWNMGTSACWEPLIIGKSFDQNNPFRSAVALAPLNRVILSGKTYDSFDELLESYKKGYKEELKSVVKNIDFDCSPLFTLFFDDCIKREKDFTDGGAVYANHGAQVVSFPNAINALLNIKRLVYDEKKYTLSDCKKAIENNFEGMVDFQILLSTTGAKFGSTEEEVVNITNDLIEYTSNVISVLRSNGQPVKVGFSSPSYIGESRGFAASLDGRRAGEPFAVHISPMSSKIDISEVLDFSSKLKYGYNCINGNVVDFILPSSYIKHHEKLVGILKDACSKGIFELQLNVMDKATLIDAKAHPEKYPNLIVRVWGFSAYFNDLPEEFKDNLIRRAEIYEAA